MQFEKAERERESQTERDGAVVRLVFSPTPCLTDDRRPRYRCFALDTKEEKEEAMMMTVAIRLNYDRGRTDGRPNHLLRRRRTNGRRGREDRPTNDLQMPKAKKAGENAAGRRRTRR